MHRTLPRTRLFLATGLLLALGAAAGAEPAVTRAHDAAELTWNACPAFMPAGCGLAVLHGDPAQPNADVFFKVPAGANVPRHWHSSAERMVLVAGELRVQYDGQPAAVLTPGRYAYGPARLPHEASCAAGADCVLFIAFEGPVDAHEGAPPVTP